MRKIVAVSGSYRKGGTVEQAVEAVLAGAREKGAETRTIHLREQHIEFCTNCRGCMQTDGEARGRCLQEDDLEPMLKDIDSADAIVLASPVNCYNVTAIFRRWMERMVGSYFWPWGMEAPKPRRKKLTRKAVLIASSAMPGFLIPVATGAARALRLTAGILGAKAAGEMWLGLVARKPQYELTERQRERARRLGWKLAEG
jgi:putative NADPH-quinone reductase